MNAPKSFKYESMTRGACNSTSQSNVHLVRAVHTCYERDGATSHHFSSILCLNTGWGRNRRCVFQEIKRLWKMPGGRLRHFTERARAECGQRNGLTTRASLIAFNRNCQPADRPPFVHRVPIPCSLFAGAEKKKQFSQGRMNNSENCTSAKTCGSTEQHLYNELSLKRAVPAVKLQSVFRGHRCGIPNTCPELHTSTDNKPQLHRASS
jgi:hypothetical protein